jgi:carboxyl-terminal processing protease
MSQRNLAWLIVVPSLVLFTAFMVAKTPPPEPQYKMVRTVVDVLGEVEQHFYRELTPKEKQKLVEDMINGGLQRLDPYSEYFNEEKLKQFTADTQGQFGGIGAYIGIDARTGVLQIDSPMPDSPALNAGLQSGDFIIKINGKSTEAMLTDEARSLIKGEPGSKVTLTLRRRGREADFDVELTRAVIIVHPVKGYKRKPEDPKTWDYMVDPDGKIALIRLVEFSKNAAKEVQAALKDAEAAGARAVILDLRGNPGGLLDIAAEISDLFLAEGAIVRTQGRNNPDRNLKAKKDGSVWEATEKIPMAVLVNRASASAAEIVAAALQDHKRAVVVGERSYGKGSVQKSFEANDGKSALKLTTELWLTPNGKNIHRWPDSKEDGEWGVRPDAGFEVNVSEDEFIQYILHLRDADLLKPKDPLPPQPASSKDEAKKEKDGKGRPELPPLDPNFKDKVLEKALEHLRLKIKSIGRAPLLEGGKPA